MYSLIKTINVGIKDLLLSSNAIKTKFIYAFNVYLIYFNKYNKYLNTILNIMKDKLDIIIK